MIKLIDKVTKEEVKVYGTRAFEGNVQFLIFHKDRFIWNDSSYFEPKKEKKQAIDEMSMLRKTFQDGGTAVFKYCGKEIEVTASTTFDELQEQFGAELDLLDFFRANWETR